MSLQLTAQVPQDGHVQLEWAPESALDRCWVLAIRTGAVPGFTSFSLDGATRRYRLANLSRHQRYRFAVVGARENQQTSSAWVSATPRMGLQPLVEDGDIAGHAATLSRVMVMPQDRRLTLYWQAGRGFVDRTLVDILDGETALEHRTG